MSNGVKTLALLGFPGSTTAEHFKERMTWLNRQSSKPSHSYDRTTEVGSSKASMGTLNGASFSSGVHMKSTHMAMFQIKTKECGDLLLYWIQFWLQLRTKMSILRLQTDVG
jgi:hypothetical protein